MSKQTDLSQSSERRYSLADESKIFEGRGVRGFVLRGYDYQEASDWSHMVRLVCERLIAIDRPKFASLAENPSFVTDHDRRFIARATSKKDAMDRFHQRRTSEVMDGIWVDQGVGAPKLCELMQGMLFEYGINPDDVTIFLEPKLRPK